MLPGNNCRGFSFTIFWINAGTKEPMTRKTTRKKRRGALAKRRLYADLRHLVFLETAARQLKLPPIQRGPARLAKLGALNPRGFAPEPQELPGAEAPDNSPAIETVNQKENGQEPSKYSVLLVVDQRISMFYGSKRKTKSVVAAEAAALVAWRALTQEHRVGALVFNDTRIVPFAPNCSRLEVMVILHTLLNQNHLLAKRLDRRSNPQMLNSALLRVEKLSTENSLVVVITDASGHDQQTQRLLESISRRNRLILALVYDPRQIALRKVGSFIAESHIVDAKDLTHPRFTLNGMSVASLSTRDDITAQLRRIFRKTSRANPPATDQKEASPLPEAEPAPQSAECVIAHPTEFENDLMTPAPVFLQENQLSLCESPNSP